MHSDIDCAPCVISYTPRCMLGNMAGRQRDGGREMEEARETGFTQEANKMTVWDSFQKELISAESY